MKLLITTSMVGFTGMWCNNNCTYESDYQSRAVFLVSL